jgi:hypothetical protein
VSAVLRAFSASEVMRKVSGFVTYLTTGTVIFWNRNVNLDIFVDALSLKIQRLQVWIKQSAFNLPTDFKLATKYDATKLE